MKSCFNHSNYYTNDDNTTIAIRYIRGHAGFYCKHCYHPIVVKMNLEADYECDEDLDFEVRNKYYFKCPECGKNNVFEYEIDPNITPTIALLNKKGYKTKFCCEGHYTEEGPSSAYIYFDESIKPNVLTKYPLPYPWYRDMQIQKYLDESKKFVIRCNLFYKTDKRMNAIYKWAKSLPDYKNTISQT